MTRLQTLQDDIMDLKAQLYGKRMELAMARGKRPQAQVFQQRMYAVIKARWAHQTAMAIAEESQ